MAVTREPVRVLQIISGNKYLGGISQLLYNLYSHIDRDRVQFDFLYPYFATNGAYKDSIEAMGGHVFQLGIGGGKLSRKAKLYPGIKRFLKAHPYEIVHVNSGNFFFNLVATRAAKDAGVKNIIVHSHNTGDPGESSLKKTAIRLMKPLLERQLTARCACSMDAARFMFTEKAVEEGGVTVVRNGLEIGRFCYDPEARAAVRRELNIEGKRAVGHVGRFFPQKNQAYLIRVFARLAERDPDAVLLMLGDGEDMEAIRAQARALGVEDRAFFLGTRTDVERYYQAFDAFAFPSAWEGLGMVLVEAQISGLRCVASTRVPREADATGDVTFIDLGDENIDRWAEAVGAAMHGERRSREVEVAAAGYDIDAVAAQMANRYCHMAGRA